MAPTITAPQNAAQAAFERAVKHHLTGRLDDAAASYREALRFKPEFPEAANNLGTIVAGKGHEDDALALFERATWLAPGYGEAHNNAGLVLSRLGRHAEARLAFELAMSCDAANGDWSNNLGNACIELFHFEAALAAYDVAVRAQPRNSEFWSNRALALRGLRRPEDALLSLQQAIKLNEKNVNALSNLGVILKEEKRFEDAITTFERAVALEPENVALVANFASVFEPMARYDRMRELATRATEIDPSYAESWNLLANCEMEAGHYTKSRELYQRAVALDPENRNANWNLAILALLHGDFAYGWRQFEWRKRLQSVLIDYGHYDGPKWDGAPLDGRTILLHTEQGIGDAIQFIRYAAELKRLGAGRVIVECPYPVGPLLSGVSGVDRVVARGTPLPAYDTHANLMSLPFLLGTTLQTVPAAVPYIPVEPRPAAAAITAAPGTTKIGIVWAGNPIHQRDLLRSVELTRFAPLFDVPGTAFFSLQKGEAAEGKIAALADARLTNLASHLADFRDTAAVLERLDLVITVDTSVAHLAGALGRPTWLLIPHVPDFRWLLDRSDSPWYPTMRIFRQPRPGDWDTVFADVEAALRERVTGSNATPATPNATIAGLDASTPGTFAVSSLGGDEPTTSLSSATRLPDGRPRFDLWLPLSVLADSPAFAAYEQELVGVGYDRALRDFWDEALGPDHVLVDLSPELGLTALSVLTSSREPSVIAVEPDGAAADRLLRIAELRGFAERCAVAPTLDAAVERALGRTGAPLAARTTSPPGAQMLVRALRARQALPRLTMLGMSGVDPKEARDLLCELAKLGYVAFDATWQGEVVLDPLADWEKPKDIILVTSVVLERLVGAANATSNAPLPPAPSPEPRRTPAPQPGVGAVTEIGIDWELRADSGWGVYGTQLATALAARAGVTPAIFAAELADVSPLATFRLRDAFAALEARSRELAAPNAPLSFGGVMLRALGNNFGHGPLWERIRAKRNVGVIFFEDTAFDAAALERARSLDLVVAGSSWNADVLRGVGLTNVEVALQGIDPTVFHPAPRSGRFADRFVVFSGGKLEYRKGQDIVVAAFRVFRERHPEALLLTAWHNNWPALLHDLSLAGHVRGLPEVRQGKLELAEWLTANGLPTDAALDVGRVPNGMMGQIVREADVALFTNRCEGGTNLVAMECMAAGVPTILSSNTGHLDLIATGGCVPIRRQRTVPRPTRFFRATNGWGESDVDEVVDVLERAWTDRQTMRDIARAGAEAMMGWTWRTQVDRLLSILRPLLG